jgi:hypothetical protein
MSKLDRLKNLPGAKVSGKEKPASTVTDLGQLVKELQAITVAQQSSEESITKAINQLSKVVLMASEDGFNMTEIVNAINGLKDVQNSYYIICKTKKDALDYYVENRKKLDRMYRKLE